jgi:16S rRNA (cytosine1402-N4)-methyltransferase
MDYHEPVLLGETINGLNINPSGTYVDATFGGGGHSRAILSRLKRGRLYAFDQDAEALKNVPQDKRFHFIQGNFRFITNYLKLYGITKVDGILADLGVSSHHLNEAKRGFSFRFDSDLDMRMNLKAKLDASKLVNNYSREQLLKIFREYGEIENSARLVNEIVSSREKQRIEKTGEFVNAISSCIPRRNENQYLAKVFQALRIEVNKEISNLKEFLTQSIRIVKPGGRVAIISYHSLEDRLVKNFFRWGNFYEQAKKDVFGNMDVPFNPVTRKHIQPSDEEIIRNNRARSAKLRIAEKN